MPTSSRFACILTTLLTLAAAAGAGVNHDLAASATAREAPNPADTEGDNGPVGPISATAMASGASGSASAAAAATFGELAAEAIVAANVGTGPDLSAAADAGLFDTLTITGGAGFAELFITFTVQGTLTRNANEFDGAISRASLEIFGGDPNAFDPNAPEPNNLLLLEVEASPGGVRMVDEVYSRPLAFQFGVPFPIFAELRVEQAQDGAAEFFSTARIISLSVQQNGAPLTGVTITAASGTSYPTPTCVGDLDGSGFVDLSDLAGLLASFGLSIGDPAFDPAADFNNSGTVDLSDLAGLLANFGTPCA